MSTKLIQKNTEDNTLQFLIGNQSKFKIENIKTVKLHYIEECTTLERTAANMGKTSGFSMSAIPGYVCVKVILKDKTKIIGQVSGIKTTQGSLTYHEERKQAEELITLLRKKVAKLNGEDTDFIVKFKNL